MKTRMGKNHGEREENSTIIMVIIMGFSDVLGFLDLNDRPPPR